MLTLVTDNKVQGGGGRNTSDPLLPVSWYQLLLGTKAIMNLPRRGEELLLPPPHPACKPFGLMLLSARTACVLSFRFHAGHLTSCYCSAVSFSSSFAHDPLVVSTLPSSRRVLLRCTLVALFDNNRRSLEWFFVLIIRF